VIRDGSMSGRYARMSATSFIYDRLVERPDEQRRCAAAPFCMSHSTKDFRLDT